MPLLFFYIQLSPEIYSFHPIVISDVGTIWKLCDLLRLWCFISQIMKRMSTSTWPRPGIESSSKGMSSFLSLWDWSTDCCVLGCQLQEISLKVKIQWFLKVPSWIISCLGDCWLRLWYSLDYSMTIFDLKTGELLLVQEIWQFGMAVEPQSGVKSHGAKRITIQQGTGEVWSHGHWGPLTHTQLQDHVIVGAHHRLHLFNDI